MKGLVKGPQRWRAGLLATVVMLGSVTAVVLGQGTAGANSFKPFAVNLCAPPTGTPAVGSLCPLGGSASVIAPGSASSTTGSSPASLEADFKDETSKGGGLTIGSINLTAPSGVTFASANFIGSAAFGTCTSSTPATTSCVSQDGSALELRGLNVAPGATLQVAISLATPTLPSSCTTATPCQFTVGAKQSNDYNGPPGNQLNLDSAKSQLGIALESDTTCTALHGNKTNTCTNTLGDGGATGSIPGTVSFTTNATGSTGGVFYESIDYGAPLNNCGAGFDTEHSEYINGIPSGRTFTVTVTTTNFQNDPTYGTYQAELCAETSLTFMAKPGPGIQTSLVSATAAQEPDGSNGFEGLLPDCSTNPNAVGATVKPTAGPCVLSRSPFPVVTDGSQPTHTMVASYPANFDSLRQSN